MSADNGIYILRALDGFRVTSAQAIDNIYWWGDEQRTEINPEILIEYFGDCKVYQTDKEALQKAEQLYDEIMNDDYCPICEYGICYIDYPHHFPQKLNKYTHIEKRVGLFRFSFYKLGQKFTVRFELSKGWD